MKASLEPPFPFLWGTATSSHQVEGYNVYNDWWAWEDLGRVKEASGLASNHYRLFREDFDLISELGHNAHRLSLEWSRLEPKKDQWNEEAFLHYEQVLAELTSRGIEPVVTLHHFTNPQWFSGLGGWLDPDAPNHFADYVDRVVRRFGAWVRIWITINEPMVLLYHGYVSGTWPPGEKSLPKAFKAMRNLLRGHQRAYQKIHEAYDTIYKKPVWVSLAKHAMVFAPCRPHSYSDRISTWFRDWFFNDLFLKALWSGFLFVPGFFCEFLEAQGTLDFIGVNYYRREFVQGHFLSGSGLMGESCLEKHPDHPVEERNVLGWEVYPEGLLTFLKRWSRFQVPLMVTENGICTEDDTQRARFIQSHVAALEQARAQGISVTGYFYWSLLDNFEWAEGFGPRFGIVEVDFKKQSRKIRPSAQILGQMCRNIGSRRI